MCTETHKKQFWHHPWNQFKDYKSIRSEVNSEIVECTFKKNRDFRLFQNEKRNFVEKDNLYASFREPYYISQIFLLISELLFNIIS